MEVTDGPGLTHSSDPTSEDVRLEASAYKETMLLLEELGVVHMGSATLLKMQNILLEYERRIERQKNQYKALSREVRKLEDEREESQFRAEKTQDLKSVLAHQEAEWKRDIQSLKCSLKQEEEKRLRVEVLCEKRREDLRRKEDQYCKEIEEKQKLELQSRNSEMELRTLRKLLKQESSTDREQDLLYKNQLLQDEIAVLRLELTQFKNLNFICHQKAMLNEDFPENVMNAFACKSSSIVTSLTCKKPTRACLCSCVKLKAKLIG
ncbi:ankyrin repeat domain-containing protein 26-like [Falco biarmicus]|uniref:ankyrin repeat domain-containing protein 26-like n=1 Tax=Falco biarmicus TaxID=345155 RepID=UPI0024BCE780|nr:ankyrin repeat domain-containing protein 26-like [Falco biarmicus]